MASILDFFPIITIFSVGIGIWWVINKFESFTFRRTEYFNLFLLLGSFSLILPLTWIGIQPTGSLILSINTQSIELIDFRGWCFIFFIFGLILTIIIGYSTLRKILASLENFRFEVDAVKDYKILLICFLLLDYLILELILPLRGFDALYYYFPETEVFYQAGRITEVNYLSFLPVVKSPLHVLLFVYAYYVTADLSIQLFPFLFLLGLVFLAYDFSIELFHNRSIALTTSIFTLSLPFIYWLMNYWAFYQDLYLCYFFSLTCYFSLKWYKSPKKLSFGVYIAMAIINSLLTKITAWILPIILILWLPSGSKGKVIRFGVLSLLGLFLCAQAITRIFIGVAIPIVFSLGSAGFFILKEKVPEYSTRALIRLIPIGFGMLIGSFWLNNRINLSETVGEEIYNLYFRYLGKIIWVYTKPPDDPLLLTLETVHGANFISAATLLLLSTCFVLPWFILKVLAIRNFRPITAPLLWILVTFAIWSTYYFNGSIRYLVPIIIPFVLCVSWGLHKLVIKIEEPVRVEFITLLLVLFGCTSFYYLIPLRSILTPDQNQDLIGIAYNRSALSYHIHPEVLILQIIGFSLLILLFVKKNLQISLNLFNRSYNFVWIRKILFCAIIIIPLSVQSFLLLYTQGDLVQFHAIHEYEYRTEYKDLVTVIQQQNQPFAAILTVRTPGLQFFIGQPVIDIYYQRNFFPADPFFTLTNLTELLEVLQNPLNHTIETDFEFDLSISLKFIVVPSVNNIYYNIYKTQIREKSLLFQELYFAQNFTLLYGPPDNYDFCLYEVIFP
ncbi:MAG: hypothetical protein ACFE9L_02625 [Candidatus Hodarchaeota archaeon]